MAGRATDIAPFDPTSPNFCRDFYSEMTRMREACRAYRHEGTLIPIVSFFRYDDVQPMLADSQNWSSERSEKMRARGLGSASIMVGDDPPVHTRYRKIMAPYFTPAAIRVYDDIIEGLLDEAIEMHVGVGETDFVQFADYIAVGLICEICGIPKEDRELIRSKAMEVAIHYGKGLFWKEEHPEIEATIAKISWDFGFYFLQHVERLKTSGSQSMLASMAAQLNDAREIASMCALLIAAGVETTTNSIVHGIQEFIRNPGQMELLRCNPDAHLDGAVEEIVRYRGTLRRQERVARRNVEIDGVQIEKDDTIILWTAAASRDPSYIDRPDEFDITRWPNRHIGYGYGIHTCIGNVLARSELRRVFSRLVKATSHIEEARGNGSYQDAGNGVMDVALHYHLKLHA